MSAHRPRIYLAGPEVFLPEARALGEAKARLAAAAGFEGLFPLDTSLVLDGLSNAGKAAAIYRADVDLMGRCELAIANLTPFRGVSMDPGTAFEVGYMRALNKPVLGYTNVAASYRERANAYRGLRRELPDADRADASVEDFDLAENLMIEVAIIESGGSVVRCAVPPGREMADLAGFARCLEQARGLTRRPG
jgi:nucleoside 2-deoxyribosyltransferase